MNLSQRIAAQAMANKKSQKNVSAWRATVLDSGHKTFVEQPRVASSLPAHPARLK